MEDKESANGPDKARHSFPFTVSDSMPGLSWDNKDGYGDIRNIVSSCQEGSGDLPRFHKSKDLTHSHGLDEKSQQLPNNMNFLKPPKEQVMISFGANKYWVGQMTDSYIAEKISLWINNNQDKLKEIFLKETLDDSNKFYKNEVEKYTFPTIEQLMAAHKECYIGICETCDMIREKNNEQQKL